MIKKTEFDELIARIQAAETMDKLNAIELPKELSKAQRQLAYDHGHSAAMRLEHSQTSRPEDR